MDATPLYIISIPGKEAGSMLNKLPLNGKKTNIVVAVTVIYAVRGILLSEMPWLCPF